IVARAEALAQLDREREARRGLQRLVDAETKDPRVYLALGRLLFAARRNDEAVAMLREAKDRAPLDSSIQIEVADQFERHGLHQEALELYANLADNDPRLRPDLAWRMAVIMQEAGARPGPQGDLVERYYQMALQANPNHLMSLNNLAFHYAEYDRELPTARQLADRALELQGSDPNLLDTRGWVALKLGDLPGASKYLARALSKRPNDALTLYHWARLRQKLGDAAGAKAAARRALTLSPKFIGRDACAGLVEGGGTE
ncbi:MAG: tetratricopeptide repeat protein, partial [Armatimonadetes bacterium]|nr:tetratricopeptide repeat protein [Armatimonadota bacterium]